MFFLGILSFSPKLIGIHLKKWRSVHFFDVQVVDKILLNWHFKWCFLNSLQLFSISLFEVILFYSQNFQTFLKPKIFYRSYLINLKWKKIFFWILIKISKNFCLEIFPSKKLIYQNVWLVECKESIQGHRKPCFRVW